jgi:predicted amidohydrolase YtcJ
VSADLVILGPVHTGDAVRRWADAVAVTGDRITAVGTEAQVREQVGPATHVIDARDGLVLPGFVDAHVHPPFAGRNRLNVSLLELEGRDTYLAAIRSYADAHPEREWIVGGGWAMEFFPGGTPDRDDLDAVVPDRPVFLYNRDTHGAWLNSRALELGGITDDTPDPDDGRYERDADGRVTGMLHEGAAYSFEERFVPKPDAAEWRAALLDAQAHLHSLGITAWQDAWVTEETLAAYLTLDAEGLLSAHVVGALWWDRHRGLEQVEDLLAWRKRSAGTGGRFRPTTVKIMVDGVLENYTGSLLAPYCDGCGGHTDNTGLQFVDPAMLAEAVTRLDSLGFQVHMHTIGDRAVRTALDAVEAARATNGPADRRHHLAHIQVVQPDDVPRFRRLGVAANCQALWAHLEPQMTELTIPFLGDERAAMQYPFGDLLREGTVLAMGSDWPVTTADPLQQLEVAVTRVGPEYRGTEPFLPAQALTLADAIAAFTRGSAYVNHDEEDSGTIAVGMRADLAVLDRDLFSRDAGPIGDARVTHTLASGRLIHG